jgi:hypothetical protein
VSNLAKTRPSDNNKRNSNLNNDSRNNNRDSPPSSAEVKNEKELCLLSPHVPPWRVAGQLYFFYFFITMGSHCCTTMNPCHAGCLSPRENAAERHGRAHKVFFAHAHSVKNAS